MYLSLSFIPILICLFGRCIRSMTEKNILLLLPRLPQDSNDFGLRTHIEFQPLGHLTEFPWMSCDVTRHQPFSIREKRNIRVPLNCVELIPNLISQYRKVHWKFSSFHMIRRKPPSNILSSHHIYNSNRRHSTCKDSRMCVVRVWKIHCVDIYCCAKCE